MGSRFKAEEQIRTSRFSPSWTQTEFVGADIVFVGADREFVGADREFVSTLPVCI